MESQALSTNFCHLCGKWSTAAMYSSLFTWCKEAMTAMLISPSDSNHLPQRPSLTNKMCEQNVEFFNVKCICV
jgi:hypothetical protein